MKFTIMRSSDSYNGMQTSVWMTGTERPQTPCFEIGDKPNDESFIGLSDRYGRESQIPDDQPKERLELCPRCADSCILRRSWLQEPIANKGMFMN